MNQNYTESISDQLYQTRPFASDKGPNFLRLWNAVDFDKFIKDPLCCIDELFAKRMELIDPFCITAWDKTLISVLHNKYHEQRIERERVKKIPCLNDSDVTFVKKAQVVSFRCMIQDMIGPEVSLSYIMETDPLTGISKPKTTLLRESVEIPDVEQPRYTYVDKEVMVGISPPGENPWVAARKDEGMGEENLDCGAGGKRRRSSKAEGVQVGDDMLNFPDYIRTAPWLFVNQISGTKPVASYLKFYRYADDLPKQNEIVEVAGLIYPRNEETEREDENAMIVDNPTPNPYRTNNFPVIHVFSVLKLANGFPKLPMITGKMAPLFDFADSQFSDCVNSLRELISTCLGGDRYAAVYVMLGLISRIFKREKTGSCLGKLVVNVCSISETSDTPDLLKRALQNLMPRLLCLDMTIASLFTIKLTPQKDLESDHLIPSLLQVANGTAILINETHLEQGQLSDLAMANMQSLKSLLTDQEVVYDYTFQHPKIPTDCQALILSDSRTVLDCDLQIKAKPETKSLSDQRCIKIKEILDAKQHSLQKYLSFLRSLSLEQYALFAEESLAQDFENFFRVRNIDGAFNSKMSPQDFSAFITCCRLWCLMNGQLSITRDGFMFMKELEQIRDSRLGSQDE